MLTRWTWSVCARTVGEDVELVCLTLRSRCGEFVLDTADEDVERVCSHGGRGASVLDTEDEDVERVCSTLRMKTWSVCAHTVDVERVFSTLKDEDVERVFSTR